MKSFLVAVVLIVTAHAASAQSDSLKIYTGKYKFPEGSVVAEVTVTYENGSLTGITAMGNTELRITGTADVFEVVAYGGTATFKRKDNKVVGVQIQVNDLNLEGTKVEGSFDVGWSPFSFYRL